METGKETGKTQRDLERVWAEVGELGRIDLSFPNKLGVPGLSK